MYSDHVSDLNSGNNVQTQLGDAQTQSSTIMHADASAQLLRNDHPQESNYLRWTFPQNLFFPLPKSVDPNAMKPIEYRRQLFCSPHPKTAATASTKTTEKSASPQNPPGKFAGFAPELIIEIASNLHDDPKSLRSLAFSCKHFYLPVIPQYVLACANEIELIANEKGIDAAIRRFRQIAAYPEHVRDPGTRSYSNPLSETFFQKSAAALAKALPVMIGTNDNLQFERFSFLLEKCETETSLEKKADIPAILASRLYSLPRDRQLEAFDKIVEKIESLSNRYPAFSPIYRAAVLDGIMTNIRHFEPSQRVAIFNRTWEMFYEKLPLNSGIFFQKSAAALANALPVMIGTDDNLQFERFSLLLEKCETETSLEKKANIPAILASRLFSLPPDRQLEAFNKIVEKTESLSNRYPAFSSRYQATVLGGFVHEIDDLEITNPGMVSRVVRHVLIDNENAIRRASDERKAKILSGLMASIVHLEHEQQVAFFDKTWAIYETLPLKAKVDVHAALRAELFLLADIEDSGFLTSIYQRLLIENEEVFNAASDEEKANILVELVPPLVQLPPDKQVNYLNALLSKNEALPDICRAELILGLEASIADFANNDELVLVPALRALLADETALKAAGDEKAAKILGTAGDYLAEVPVEEQLEYFNTIVDLGSTLSSEHWKDVLRFLATGIKFMNDEMNDIESPHCQLVYNTVLKQSEKLPSTLPKDVLVGLIDGLDVLPGGAKNFAELVEAHPPNGVTDTDITDCNEATTAILAMVSNLSAEDKPEVISELASRINRYDDSLTAQGHADVTYLFDACFSLNQELDCASRKTGLNTLASNIGYLPKEHMYGSFKKILIASEELERDAQTSVISTLREQSVSLKDDEVRVAIETMLGDHR